ncbi:hypothetical protein TKK_0005265 [Trichogramma kaykai]
MEEYLNNSISDLKNEENVILKYMKFCTIALFNNHYGIASIRQNLVNITKNKSTFPDTKDFLKFVVHNNRLKILVFLREHAKINIHEERIVDGNYSMLHYVIEKITTVVHVLSIPKRTEAIINYFLETSSENHCDGHGYTYFHAACLANHVEAVQRFVSACVDVNLDTWRLSPLQVAVHYGRPDIVRILLENGADPNRLDDRGRSTALHALAHLRVCDCFAHCRDPYSKDEDGPIDAILDLLIAKGMNIEVQNRLGLTALQWAVSHLDCKLVRSLLKRGASLDPLSKHMSFAIFSNHELMKYPVIFHFVEMIRLLVANGFVFDLYSRLEILKFWIETRSQDTEVFISEIDEVDYMIPSYVATRNYLLIHEKLGFYAEPKTVERLRKHLEQIANDRRVASAENLEQLTDRWETEATQLKSIMINEDISLYQICQMNYSKASCILKEKMDWRLPTLDGVNKLSLIVKKHIARAFMRTQFEMFVADLYMTDYYERRGAIYGGSEVSEGDEAGREWHLCLPW